MANRYLRVVLIAFVLSSVLSCSRTSEPPKQTDTSAAPLFVTDDINGKKISLADYRGKVVILDFFATWCEPCRLLAPELQKVHEKYKDGGVAVISVAADEGSDAVADLKSFVRENHISYIVAMGGETIMKQYGVYSLPTTVIIDREGKIRIKHLGVTASYAKRLSGEIDPLLK